MLMNTTIKNLLFVSKTSEVDCVVVGRMKLIMLYKKVTLFPFFVLIVFICKRSLSVQTGLPSNGFQKMDSLTMDNDFYATRLGTLHKRYYLYLSL